MKQDAAAYMELPEGNILIWESSADRKAKFQRMNNIIEFWQANGYDKPDDVPEGDKRKDEFRELARSVGLKVQF